MFQGGETYYLGAKLLACMLFDNPAQPWVKVEVPVLGGICAAQQAIAAHVPKRLMYVGLQGGSTTRRRRSKSSASTTECRAPVQGRLQCPRMWRLCRAP